MVELLFPLTLREDMKDVFIHPRGLGLRGVYNGLRNVNIPASLMYLYYYGFYDLSTPQMRIPIWVLYPLVPNSTLVIHGKKSTSK